MREPDMKGMICMRSGKSPLFSGGFAILSFFVLFPLLFPIFAQEETIHLARELGAALDESDGGALQRICLSLRPEQCEEAERILLQGLDLPGLGTFRVNIVRALGWIGSGECAQILKKHLPETEDRFFEEILRTLAMIPDRFCGDLLRDALHQTEDLDRKIAIIDALAYREERESVDSLAAEIVDVDQLTRSALEKGEVRSAAFREKMEDAARLNGAIFAALGRIGGEEAAQILRNQRFLAWLQNKKYFGPPLLEAAGKHLRWGQERSALEIFTELNKTGEFSSVLTAAYLGMVRITSVADEQGRGIRDPDYLLFLLRGIDFEPVLRSVCITAFWNLPDGVAQIIPEETYRQFPEDFLVSMLYIFGEKRDRSAIPMVEYALKNQNEAVQRAAYRSLGGVGDSGAISRLLDVLSRDIQERESRKPREPNPTLREWTIRDALARTVIEGAEEAFVDAMNRAKTGEEKRVLLEIMRERKCRFYNPHFQGWVKTEEGPIQIDAIRGIGEIGNLEDRSVLVHSLSQVEQGPLRESLEESLLEICRRNMGDREMSQWILKQVGKTEKSKQPALFGLLSRIGGEESFRIVQDAMRNGDAKAKESAFYALHSWSDEHAIEELYRLATRLVNSTMSRTALRGYIRLITEPNTHSESENLARIEKAMKTIDNPEDRDVLLERLGALRFKGVLEILSEHSERPGAQRSVLELAKDPDFYRQNRERFVPLLEKILRSSEQRVLIEQARELLEQ